MEGDKIAPPKLLEPTKPADLMEALRQSVGEIHKTRTAKPKRAGRKQVHWSPKTTKRKKVA
jgi:non-homologous end joining protein Ku